MSAITVALKHASYFANLPDPLLAALANRGKVLAMPDKAVVCREGESSAELFVILSGTVDIYQNDPSEGDLLVQTLHAGDFLGELAFLDGQPRTATALCRGVCQLFVLERNALMTFMEQNSQVSRYVILALTGRLRQRIQTVFDKEVEQRTIETEAELERSRALAQMVAGVAHELNTPLGIANMTADMIVKRVNSAEITTALQDHPAILEDIREAGDLLERNIQRAHKLIESFKKISVSQVSDCISKVDLRDAIEDIVGVMRPTLRQARLDVQVRGLKSAEWTGYRGYLTQVLINLLTNIERYAYDVGGRAEIILDAVTWRNAPAFTIMVRDFGKGISAENLPQIFNPFFTTGRIKGGTGLGMAIVYNLVTEALNGNIEIDSELGRGTTVTLTIPQQVSA